MIRIVTLSEFPPDVIDFVTRRLHAAYGMGSELEGEGEIPKGALDDEQSAYDAVKAVDEMDDDVALYADDKILYLTSEPLTAPPGPMGRGPVDGYAQYGGGKAVATSHGLGRQGRPARRGARQAGRALRRPPLGPAPLLRSALRDASGMVAGIHRVSRGRALPLLPREERAEDQAWVYVERPSPRWSPSAPGRCSSI